MKTLKEELFDLIAQYDASGDKQAIVKYLSAFVEGGITRKHIAAWKKGASPPWEIAQTVFDTIFEEEEEPPIPHNQRVEDFQPPPPASSEFVDETGMTLPPVRPSPYAPPRPLRGGPVVRTHPPGDVRAPDIMSSSRQPVTNGPSLTDQINAAVIAALQAAGVGRQPIAPNPQPPRGFRRRGWNEPVQR